MGSIWWPVGFGRWGGTCCGSASNIPVIMVSIPEQSAIQQKATLDGMVEDTRIVSAKLEGEYGLIVTFTDGTEDAYTVEELLELRPYRDLVRKPMDSQPLLW